MPEPSQERPSSRLILVVGVGRSGTSLLTGILGQLGLYIPRPEVQADDTNPRGFGEPRWVVDFHDRLLRERRVTVNDARPAAWEITHGVGHEPALRAWLAEQLAQPGPVVVKDPRTVWFLPLWTRTAADLGAEASFVTMLRHPAEIVRSQRKSYGTWQTEASRTAAAVNIMLETEHATRGARRAFVRYEDLLADWPREIRRVGAALDLPALATVERVPEVDRFVDPALHRNRVRWDELDVPAQLVDRAEDAWRRVQPLTTADTPETHAALDEARAAYIALYTESEAIAQSSVTAAKPRRRRGKPPRAPSLKVRLARRVPPRYRRRIRSAVRALRPS